MKAKVFATKKRPEPKSFYPIIRANFRFRSPKKNNLPEMYLRQFVPAFVSRASPVGGSLTGIHQSSGTLGLRAILSLNIHQFGILKIQTPFPAPILAARTNRLFPLKLRYRCFLYHSCFSFHFNFRSCPFAFRAEYMDHTTDTSK